MTRTAYTSTINAIQVGIREGTSKVAQEEDGKELPFDAELIPRTIHALLGTPQERMQHAQYLNALNMQTTDEAFKALMQTIQVSLFGADRSLLGQNLTGVYQQAWEAIVLSVEAEGIDPRVFDLLVHNTLAVLGSAPDQKDAWKVTLADIRRQAQEGEAHQLVRLVDAVVRLIDTNGDPAGLGEDLQGIYAKVWQTIVTRRPSSGDEDSLSTDKTTERK